MRDVAIQAVRRLREGDRVVMIGTTGHDEPGFREAVGEVFAAVPRGVSVTVYDDPSDNIAADVIGSDLVLRSSPDGNDWWIDERLSDR